jgi:hypothetical protein
MSVLLGVLNTTFCDKVCQQLVTGQWFSPVFATNKTDIHGITEILLKVALNTINQTKPNLCDMKFFSFLTFYMYMPSR